jgi:hypothetical protein
MNTLCLDNYGVSEIETREMKTSNGGWIQVAIAVVALAITVLNTDWDKAADDFNRGYNA